MQENFSFDDYKRLTGKHFRMSKDQSDRKLSREQALAEWLADQEKKKEPEKPKVHTGNVTIELIRDKDVDPDYEFPQCKVCVRIDNKAAGILDELWSGVYTGVSEGERAEMIMQDIFDLGLGEVFVTISYKK